MRTARSGGGMRSECLSVTFALSGALFYLSELYYTGDDVCQLASDPDKARILLEQAADAGEADATFLLADCHYHGRRGCDVDLPRALRLYEQAGDRGVSDALCCAGAMYYAGYGTPPSFERAFALYQVRPLQSRTPCNTN